MYEPMELARFALSEFERGLDGLADEDARARLTKADGTQMNAISWTVGHVAQHWFGVRWMATLEPGPGGLLPFRSGPAADPTPPPLAEVLELLRQVRAGIDWIAEVADEAFTATREEALKAYTPHMVDLGAPGESAGTALMRAILHTWFHTGEVNAIRQMLGHPEIFYVGRLKGNLEWRS